METAAARVAWLLEHEQPLPPLHTSHVHGGGTFPGEDITMIARAHFDGSDGPASSVALRLTGYTPYIVLGPPTCEADRARAWTHERVVSFVLALSRLLCKLCYGVPADGHVWSAGASEEAMRGMLAAALRRDVLAQRATPNPVVHGALVHRVECENPAALPAAAAAAAAAGPWLRLHFETEQQAALAANCVSAACGTPAYHPGRRAFVCPVPGEKAQPGTRADSWLPPSLRDSDIAVADTDISTLVQCLASAGLAAAGPVRLTAPHADITLVPRPLRITTCDIELRVPWYLAGGHHAGGHHAGGQPPAPPAIDGATAPLPADSAGVQGAGPLHVLFVAIEQGVAKRKGAAAAAAATAEAPLESVCMGVHRMLGSAAAAAAAAADPLDVQILTRLDGGGDRALADAVACRFETADPDVVVLWDAERTLGALLRHTLAHDVAPARLSRFPKGRNTSYGARMLAGRTIVDMHALLARPAGLGGVRPSETPADALQAAELLLGPASAPGAVVQRQGLVGEHAQACVHALERLWARTRPDAEASAFAALVPLTPDCAPPPSVLSRALLQRQLCLDRPRRWIGACSTAAAAAQAPSCGTPVPSAGTADASTDEVVQIQDDGGGGDDAAAILRVWVRETWNGKGGSFAGGHVRTPERGLYLDPVVVLDATALYPNIMRAGYVPGAALRPADPGYARARGVPVLRDAHVTAHGDDAAAAAAAYPECIENAEDIDPHGVAVSTGALHYALGTRTSLTRALDSLIALQASARERPFPAACKVARNAVYGCMGQRGGPIYSPHTAAAVCAVGRAVIQLAALAVPGARDGVHASVVYGDTDSVFVRLESTRTPPPPPPLEHTEAARMGIELARQLGDRVGAQLGLAPYLHFKAETLFRRLLLTDKAKHYAGQGHALSAAAAAAAAGDGVVLAPLALTVKGLQPVRRDCTPLTVTLYTRTLERLLDVETPTRSGVLLQLVRTLADTVAGRIASPAQLTSSVLLSAGLLRRSKSEQQQQGASPPRSGTGKPAAKRARKAPADADAQLVHRLLTHPVVGPHMHVNDRVAFLVAADGSRVHPAEVLQQGGEAAAAAAVDFAPQWRWYVREARVHLGDLLEPLVGSMGVAGSATPRSGPELLERLLDSLPVELDGAAALAAADAGVRAVVDRWTADLCVMALDAAVCAHTHGDTARVCLVGSCAAAWTRWRAERDLRVLETVSAQLADRAH